MPFTPAPCPLPTRWTETVRPESVHPEHPRPQLTRATPWMSLNGLYECAIRPREEGRPAQFDRRILVPFPVESSLSGIRTSITAAERIWYRRRFSAPAAPDGHTWLLHFGAVDWRAEVWLDGRELGSHEGGYDPFTFDAGSLGGEHELIIAVWDPTEDGPQPRGKQMRQPPFLMRPFFYTPASGIWQTVWLEQAPEQRIERLQCRSHGSRLSVTAVAPGLDAEVIVVARLGDREVSRTAGNANRTLTLDIPEPRLWSPDDPFLYDLEVTLVRDGDQRDQVRSYFGLRDVDVRRDRFGTLRLHLNGQPIFLHGLLDQGYWPDGIYTAPCDEALRFDIEETRRLGFNCIRKHVKIEPARWYWHCDRLGLLVLQDMPNGDRFALGVPIGGVSLFDPTRWLGQSGIRRTPESARIFGRELDAMIATLGNSPSVIAWVVFNEGWGQFDTVRWAEHVAATDPTRLVDAASGWIDSAGAGHVRDVHVYHPGPRMPAKRDPQRAEILGEWGGLGLEINGHRWPKRAFAYKKLADVDELTSHYEQRLQQLLTLAQRGFAAAVYTQTTDVEGEINGVLTYDRERIKLDEPRLIAANRHLLESLARDHR